MGKRLFGHSQRDQQRAAERFIANERHDLLIPRLEFIEAQVGPEAYQEWYARWSMAELPEAAEVYTGVLCDADQATKDGSADAVEIANQKFEAAIKDLPEDQQNQARAVLAHGIENLNIHEDLNDLYTEGE